MTARSAAAHPSAFGPPPGATPVPRQDLGRTAGRRTVRTLVATASLLGLGLLPRPADAQEVIEYYAQDALGSVRVVFDAAGQVTGRADYEPFGEAFTWPGAPGGALPVERFTGQERDPEASQDYFGARYYQPRPGRFSQGDPVYAGLFDPQQWNRYAYARNNPLSFVDPDGKAACTGTYDTICFPSLNNPVPWGGVAGVSYPPSVDRTYNDILIAGVLSGYVGTVFEVGIGGHVSGQDWSSTNATTTGPTDPKPAVPPTAVPAQAPPCNAVTGEGCGPSLAGAAIKGFIEGVVGTGKALFGSKGPPSCFGFFISSTIHNLFPYTPSWSAAAEPVAAGAALMEHNRALAYAATRPNVSGGQGLLYPLNRVRSARTSEGAHG
jgi:RHS repeat-associated protein